MHFQKHLSTIKMVYAEKDSPENMKMYSLLQKPTTERQLEMLKIKLSAFLKRSGSKFPSTNHVPCSLDACILQTLARGFQQYRQRMNSRSLHRQTFQITTTREFYTYLDKNTNFTIMVVVSPNLRGIKSAKNT